MTGAYTQADCEVCRGSRAFRLLEKRDARGRKLMVCTRCSVHIPQPTAATSPVVDPNAPRHVRPDGKRECAVCGVHYRAQKVGRPTVAHFDHARRRWCPGGATPTKQQKAARKAKGQSVRAVNGGLPGLGKS